MYLNGADLNDVVKWPEITQSDETAIYKITWWLKTLLTMYEDQTNLQSHLKIKSNYNDMTITGSIHEGKLYINEKNGFYGKMDFIDHLVDWHSGCVNIRPLMKTLRFAERIPNKLR